MSSLEAIIDKYFDKRQELTPENAPLEIKEAIDMVLDELDKGNLRVAELIDNNWKVNEWLKKAVLISFRIFANKVFDAKYCQFYDKLPMKFQNLSETEYKELGVRIVPDAIVRHGAYIGKNSVLMPSYVNIGAYIDQGTMIDTWATVGSCAQIGKNVHISGGAGIGGVLEPIQAAPTIIEDNCFIGARSEIVEGVIVERDSVISMGVFIGQSTKIYNRLTGEISYGRVPRGSVVVSGSLPGNDGKHSLYCAVIIKQVDEQTRSKVSVNELLRA